METHTGTRTAQAQFSVFIAKDTDSEIAGIPGSINQAVPGNWLASSKFLKHHVMRPPFTRHILEKTGQSADNILSHRAVVSCL